MLAWTISLRVWLAKLMVDADAGGPAGAVPQVAHQASAGVAARTAGAAVTRAAASAGPACRKWRRARAGSGVEGDGDWAGIWAPVGVAAGGTRRRTRRNN